MGQKTFAVLCAVVGSCAVGATGCAESVPLSRARTAEFVEQYSKDQQSVLYFELGGFLLPIGPQLMVNGSTSLVLELPIAGDLSTYLVTNAERDRVLWPTGGFALFHQF